MTFGILSAGGNWCRDHLRCAHHCHSTALGTRCICRRGFRLHPNGKDCIGTTTSLSYDWISSVCISAV